MASLKGMSVILAPTLQEEAELPAGNARLKNCESGHLRRQLITPSLSRRYARAYAAHFELWISACLRRQTSSCPRPLQGDADGSPVRRSITAGGRGTLLNRTRTLYSPPSP